MPDELNGIYPDMTHLTPTEMCTHINAYMTHDGGFYCPDCARAMDYSEALGEKDMSELPESLPEFIFPLRPVRRSYKWREV
jgi:hypothetical protein